MAGDLEGTLTEASAAQRYVIERPRLIRLLDRSSARLIALVAPAGYGKTTLARQWLAQGGRSALWVHADEGSADVAALATEFAGAVQAIFPDAAAQMLARLSASTQPEVDAVLLGRMLARAIRDWPAGSWLVIDDYHCLLEGSGADNFVATVATESGIRLLVASRERPSWVSARRVLYDEVAVLGVEALALTRHEALEVLKHLPPRTAAVALDQARGWPAVVRLAALSGRPAAPTILKDAELYDYFAEEIFNAASSDVREALLELTPYPTLTSHVVSRVLGDTAPAMCDKAVRLGFLSRYGSDVYELHPLLREFLEVKFASRRDAYLKAQAAFEDTVSEQRWDDAHTIIVRFKRRDLYDTLIDAALPSLVARNRIGTLEAWATDAAGAGVSTPMVDLARAEAEWRMGNLRDGMASALHAARNMPEKSLHISRAYAVAGECAHILMRPNDAARWAQLAEKHAKTQEDARRAVWAQLLITFDFEFDDALNLLARFAAIADGSANAVTRVLIAKSMTAGLVGNVSLAFDESQAQLSLARRCTDVLALTSFEYRVAYLAMLAGRYAEGLAAARIAIQDIEAAGLRFAVAPVLGCLAGTMLGLRRFRRAQRLIDRLAEELRARPNQLLEANWHAIHARLLLSTGSIQAAAKEAILAVEKAPTKSMRGEALGLHALALAAGSDHARAGSVAEEAINATQEVQGVTLGALAIAISAAKADHDDADEATERAGQILRDRGNYDSLVYACRAFPTLAGELRSRNALSEQMLLRVLSAAHETDLAASLGWELRPASGPQPLLTPREQEVFALMCKGYPNRQIASDLFITEATVKVHVRHILEKFGARSRTEAVVRFARY